jgi:tRNA(fMet)-specific endonuclease VapC
MFFLDTDVLSRIHGGNERIAFRIKQEGAQNVAATVVTAIEVLRGRREFLLKASDGKELMRAQELLALSEGLLRKTRRIVPVDTRAAEEFDRLSGIKSLKKIGRADLLIASMALANGAILVTRNSKHFKLVPGLRIENWID